MKRFFSLFIVCFMLAFTACSHESWHPASTEVVFDTQQLTVEKVYENTDLGSGEMDYYRVTATAQSNTAPYYNLTMTGLIGVRYYPGQYTNIRDEKYSGYVIEEIRDTQLHGGGENMQWDSHGKTGVFTDISTQKEIAVLWGNGRYQAEHDKKTKNVSDYLPGMFFDYETTVKEYFRTEQVSMFAKLYVEEIVSCNPQQYHLQIECSDDGATFG